MLTGIKVLGAAALGIALGLAATQAAVKDGLGFDQIRAGPWTSSSNAGSQKADPYVKAVLARRAEVPLGLAEGLTFVARTDSAGRRLSGACDYRVGGDTPAARYWTLTVTTPRGELIANAARRYGFTSAEIVRDSKGRFQINVSRSARPGNWLPNGAAGPFALMLEIYDSPITAIASTLDAKSLPTIVKQRCQGP